jgi:hypothetical protein
MARLSAAMRYYLHLHNQIGSAFDEEGQELLDLAAARDQALAGIRSVLSEEIRAGTLDLRGRIEIADGAGQVLEIVPFTAAIDFCFPEGQT